MGWLRKAVFVSASAPLVAFCVAQNPGTARRSTDPCESRDRCLRVYQLGKEPTAAALERAYRSGCHGYPEQAIRALRLYQLGAPGGAQALLDSMPRGIGDFASLLWMTTDGSEETAGDIGFFYGAHWPADELVEGGCRDDSPLSITQFRAYYADLAELAARHRKYLPRFLAISQLFGRKSDWLDLTRCCGPLSVVDANAMFSGLLASLLRANPSEFKWATRWVELGGPALKQARAALAARRRKDGPARRNKDGSRTR